MYTLKNLIEMASTNTTCINGKWVPARPINHICRTFQEKLSDAWAVFIGKADAVKWPENQ